MTGSDLGGALDGLQKVFAGALLLVPLGIWKLIEIIIYVFKHVHFTTAVY